MKKIMVCVTRQKACERLIRIGKNLSRRIQGELYVVHVVKTGSNFLGNPDEGKALDYLFQVSNNANAEMNVLRSDNVIKTLVDFAKTNQIDMIILGQSPDPYDENSIIFQLERSLPDLEFKVVSE